VLKADFELLNLGQELLAQGYRFVTVTPETHARINRRPENSVAQSLEGALGWSRWFKADGSLKQISEKLQAANCLEERGDLVRSKVRFSSVGRFLFVHSAFPTLKGDAVFFGPDTYRFVRCIRLVCRSLRNRRTLRVADIGAGTGCGGIIATSQFGLSGAQTYLADINPVALRYCAVNAHLNGFPDVVLRQSDAFQNLPEAFDLIVSNPPYLMDEAGRAYRNGGDHLGTALSLRILGDALPKLTVGGVLLLYTGVPVRSGIDLFHERFRPLLADPRFAFDYDEIDPDVFGEELDGAAYRECDRLAVAQLIATRLQ
jgi:SAM-dependent methyltransferase